MGGLNGIPLGGSGPESFLRLTGGDLQGALRSLSLSAQQAAASGDSRAARAAREFQSLFLMEMLKPLTESLGRNPLAPGGQNAGAGVYDWFWQEALATELAGGWPLPEIPGVAEAAGLEAAAQGPSLRMGGMERLESMVRSAQEAGAASVRERGAGPRELEPERFHGPPAPVIPAGLAARMSLPPSVRQVLAPADGAGAAAKPAQGAAGTSPLSASAEGAAPPAAPSAATPEIETLAARAGRLLGVSPNLVRAVVAVESGGRTDAVSPKGAVGLMQLMPETAREMGVRDSTNAWENIYGGTKYLGRQIERFGSLEKALAAYNAGPTAVDRHDGIPPYPETQAYVQRVLSAKSRLDRENPHDI